MEWGIAIAGLFMSAAAVLIKVIGNRKGTCLLHDSLAEDIREIKDDIKDLIKQVAKLGG
jgi:hypothetical protein